MKKWISKISYQKRRAIFSFLFVLPWIVGFVLFSLKPIYDLFTYSFSRTHFLPDASIQLDYVGLGNYDTILITETTFITNLLDYLSQIALMLPAIVVFGLLIALLLNSSIPCRRLFRVLFFLPVILIQGTLLSTIRELNAMSIAGVDAMFVFTFIRNQLPEWLSNPIMYIINQFITIIWYSGVQILICLAGLQKLDHSMYEAAYIDGASGWQAFWKITLPVSRPFILLSAVYTVVDVSTMDSNILIQTIKEKMFTTGSGFGYPAAVATLFFIVMALIAGLVVLLLWRREKKTAA